jgi:predicted nucleotide-binding protein (sugar kinase/HSP70/actin superfamily)
LNKTAKVLSFPRLGNYHIPIAFFVRKVLQVEVLEPLPMTRRTLEVGAKYSPEFVCVPFKYNLGNFIEALERGANVLVQAGGGCRFGYYAEVQEQILRDLGYQFEFINIVPTAKITPWSIYKKFKEINYNLNILRFIYYFYLVFRMTKMMESMEKYIRENGGFATKEKSLITIYQQFLTSLNTTNSWSDLKRKYLRYNRLLKAIELDKPSDYLKIGIIGELYTAMEPFSNCDIETNLISKKIAVTRLTTVTYLVFDKLRNRRQIINAAGQYATYSLGADGTDNIARAKYFGEHGYDGIIHTKPFACTPEVDAMPILQKISRDYNIPILYLSFDAQTSEEGILTRIEAFYDMVKMRRDRNEKGLFRS